MTTPNPPAAQGGDEPGHEASGTAEGDDRLGDVTQPVSQPEPPYSAISEGSGNEPQPDPGQPSYPPPTSADQFPYGYQQPPAYGQQPPVYGQQPPAYGQQPPAYGQQPPAYGQQPPVYGQQPPAYGQQPPAYGQQPPAYGQQPPAYGQQPPAYGQQPPAYGQQPPRYGQQPGYAQPQYGAPQPWDNGAYGLSPVAGLPKEAYASWGQRVVAYLIDFAGFWIVWAIGYIVAGIGIANTDTSTYSQSADVHPLTVIGYLIVGVGLVAYVIFSIWNRWIRTGRTGMSIGKQRMGIKLVGLDTGQPIGAGMAFVRDLAHYADAFICYIGYLFPLWDDKRQTLADKIVKTVVVKTR